MIDLADIEAARRRIAPHIRKTPTLAYTQLKDGGAGGTWAGLRPGNSDSSEPPARASASGRTVKRGRVRRG